MKTLQTGGTTVGPLNMEDLVTSMNNPAVGSQMPIVVSDGDSGLAAQQADNFASFPASNLVPVSSSSVLDLSSVMPMMITMMVVVMMMKMMTGAMQNL